MAKRTLEQLLCLVTAGIISLGTPSSIKAETLTDPYTNSLPALQRSLPNNAACAPLDLMILFDSTSSMKLYINEAKQKGTTILQTIERMYPNTRYAIETVADAPAAGGSSTDRPYTLIAPFTTTISSAVQAIQSITLANGGDGPEAYPHALRMASNEAWRPNAYRIVILIADSIARNEAMLKESINHSNFKLVTL